MTLTLSYIFPDETNSFLTCTYTAASGVPVPVLGDEVAGQKASYPVRYRTWEYNGAENLTIILACFNEAGPQRDAEVKALVAQHQLAQKG